MEMINRYMKNVLIYTVMLIFLIKKCFSNDAHINLISLLEMNYPLEFTFEQNYNNDKISGWMVIAGNGMARTEFAPPNNNLIVADGKWIIFYDPEIDRTTYIPLDKGIFKAFLKPTALIADKMFQIKETKDNNKIIFTLDLNINNVDQNIKIYFDKISKNLLGWKLYESLDGFIEVKIKTFFIYLSIISIYQNFSSSHRICCAYNSFLFKNINYSCCSIITYSKMSLKKTGRNFFFFGN